MIRRWLLTCGLGLWLLVLGVPPASDALAATFENWYGSIYYDYFFEVVPLVGGGYAAAGAADADGVSARAYLVKLDADGDTVWTRSFGDTPWEYFSSLVELDDGSLVVGGRYNPDVWYRAYLVKTDAFGDTIWTKFVAEDNRSYIEELRKLSDGTILAGGSKRNAVSPSSDMDVFLLKLSADGDTLGVGICGGSGVDQCSDILELSNGGYLIAGTTTPVLQSGMASDRDASISARPFLKAPLYDESDPYGHIYLLDAGMSVVWEDTIPNAGWGKWSLIETGPDEVILTGTVNTAPGNNDIFIARIDASSTGGVDWLRTLDWPEDDDSRCIANYSEGLFLIAGNTMSLDPEGGYDAQIVLADIHGDTLYTKLYGYETWEEFSSIVKMADGEFTAVGGIDGRGAGSVDAYAVKDGIPPLAAFKASATSGDAPLTVQFDDISTFAATSWQWDFDDDGTVDSNAQNPSWEYSSPGIYTVELVAGDGVTNYTRTKQDFIVVGDTVLFTANPTEGHVPLTVYFHDHSGGAPTAWEWDFENDGTIDSYEPNPIHTFDTVGLYTVGLTVWYGGESRELTLNDYITVNPGTLLVEPDGTGDYPTIQEAINNSYDGWIIELGDGVFTGVGNREIVMGGRALTVRSRNDNPEACIIDCESAARGFNIYEFEGLDCDVIIRGITVRNGYVDTDYVGGGIAISYSEPTIINCRFIDNYAVGDGGGVACNYCSPTITDCVFIGNEAGQLGGGLFFSETIPYGAKPADISGCEFVNNVSLSGGGLLLKKSSGVVADCLFSGNSADYGGGIRGVENGDFVFSDCVFTGNTANSVGGGLHYNGQALEAIDCNITKNRAVSLHGGGFYCTAFRCDMIDCSITGNRAAYNGGGCYVNCDTLCISGSTIAADTAGTGNTGGLDLQSSAHVFLENTLVAFNEGLGIAGGSAVSCSCLDIYGNTGGDWTGALSGQLGTNGNISEDPQFCDMTADLYTISDESPCAPLANPACGLIGADSVGCLEAQFAANPTTGLAPVTVQFTDLTPGSPDGWAWDFENDGVVDDTVQNPAFEYLAGGSYSVRLKAYAGGELIANGIQQDLIQIMDGNNVFIESLEMLSQDTLPLPIVYYGSEPLGAIALYFDYDDTKIEYIGIESYVPGEFFSGGVVAGQISVQWFDETGGSDPIVPGPDPDTLFAIRFANLVVTDTTYVTFDTTQCALGDAIGDPVQDIHWYDQPPHGVVRIDIGAYVTGHVEYYWADAPVPGALLSMGPPNPDVYSDASGYYAFERYPFGDYTLHISKTDDLGGLNSLDAIKIIRHSTGVEPFGNSYKELAANVNGDGNINSLDAIKIVRASVELEPLASGDWYFEPDSVLIHDLNNDRIDDFLAVRMGDVNADWSPDAGSPLLMAAAGSRTGDNSRETVTRPENLSTPIQTVSVTIPHDSVGIDADSVLVPIEVAEFNDIGAISLRITFDDTILAYDKLESNCSAYFTSNLVDDEIRIEWYDGTGGSNPLNLGEGDLLTLHFEVLGEEGEMSGLDITDQSSIADAAGDPIGTVYFGDGSVTVVNVTGIDEDDTMPGAYRLYHCWPNPFNPSTRIRFDIPGGNGSEVRTALRIYNIAGQLVRTLVNRPLNPGRYDIVWDGRNDAGLTVASGVYFYRFEAGRHTDTKKMVLLR